MTKIVFNGGGGSLKASHSNGFTLAEVLITLGIIGIVAAMTIPTLIAEYQEKKTVTQLTKVYSTLSNAYQMMQAEYGEINTWGMSSTVQGTDEDGNKIYDYSAQRLFAERLKKYLKVLKTCQVGDVCYPYAGYSLSGIKTSDENRVEDGTGDSPAEAKFYLSDGTFVQLGYIYSTSGDIMVILPGNTSVLGKNRFYFRFSSKGIQPEGMDDASSMLFEEYCSPSLNNTLAGRGCAAWVIYNKNMDYLHCADKLSWDGPHSCKEAE